MKAVAAKQQIALPQDMSVDAEVDLGPVGRPSASPCAWRSTCRAWNAAAQALVDAAHQVCPYSNATRGNIPVELRLA